MNELLLLFLTLIDLDDFLKKIGVFVLPATFIPHHIDLRLQLVDLLLLQLLFVLLEHLRVLNLMQHLLLVVILTLRWWRHDLLMSLSLHLLLLLLAS